MQDTDPGRSGRTARAKPVIGLVGAPGSGKSAVAGVFAGMGAAVIDADALSRGVLEEPGVVARLRERWGDGVCAGGAIDRAAVASIVFEDEAERRWLESVVHPRVAEGRAAARAAAMADDAVLAVVEDVPLLIEARLDSECDVVVMVETPFEDRLARVAARGWDADELRRREAAQVPLDTKRARADHVIHNDGDLAALERRVRSLFPTILGRPHG